MSTFTCRLPAALVVFCLLMLSACGFESEEGGTAYEKLLQRSIDALNEKEQFAFSGVTQVLAHGVAVQTDKRFEGYVVGKDRLYLRETGEKSTGGRAAEESTATPQLLTFQRVSDEWSPADGQAGVESEQYRQWNPVSKLQQLFSLEKTVRLDHEQPKQTNEQVLRIDIPENEMTALIAAHLRSQHAQLTLERQLERLRTRGLEEAQVRQASAELKQVIDRSETSLTAMLETLKATGTYRLWIDRTTKLPRRMTTESELIYKKDGVEREETARAEYDFKGYDKASSIPQT